jgi:hypothetical protein
MNVLSKVPFDGIPENIAINPKENKIFASENYANLISVVDFDSRTKSSIAEINQPREIFFEPEKNRLYCVFENGGFFIRGNGKKLGIIDLNSNQIIKVIGDNEGFSGIGRNSKTGQIYVTQPNKKKVWVIDENSLEVVNKINVKGHCKKIIYAGNKDEIILGDFSFSRGLKIKSFNLQTDQIRKIFSKSSDNVLAFEMKYFSDLSKLYLHHSETVDEVGSERETISIIDYENPKSKYELGSFSVCPYFDLSAYNGLVYYIGKKSKFFKESQYQLVKRNLITDNEEIFELDFSKIFSKTEFDRLEKFVVHPKTGNLLIFVFTEEPIQLYEVTFA